MLMELGIFKEENIMKKSFIFLAVAATVLASCSKDGVLEPQSVKTVITVSTAEQTKTTIGEAVEGKRAITWAVGDKIQANELASNALTADDIQDEGATATFTFDGIVNAPVNYLYPASLYKDASTVTLPAAGMGNLPMYAYSETVGAAQMHALAAMVEFNITLGEDAHMIKKVVLSSEAASLSGDFTIDYATGALTAASAEKGKITKVVNKTLDEPLKLVVAVPAGEYALKVEVIDEMGHCMTKTVTRNFAAGEYVNMPSLAFAPTTTVVDVTINSADEWNEFATAANEDIDAYATSVVKIEADLDFTGKDVVTLGNYKATQYFTGAILGGGHKIKNLVSSKELIAGLNTEGYVEGITFDSSCSYTVKYEVGTQKHFGPLCEYVKGTVKNCHNNAAITLAAGDADNNQNIYVGGLVGRIREGRVEDCSNSGKITLDAGYKSGKYAYAGGIAGYISNPDGEVKNCTNSGSLETSAWVAQAYLGGIAGLVAGTIDGCTNSGKMSSSMARPTGDACKNIFLGGIAAATEANAVIKDCTNTEAGAMEFASAVKLLYAGGIVAYVKGTMKEFSGNSNAANITSSAGGRQFLFGGLFGKIDADNTIDLSKNSASGSIAVSGYENTTTAYIFLGGIAGIVCQEVTFNGPATVAANVLLAAEAKSLERIYMGGVVGCAGEKGNKESTGKAVTIKDVTVSGKVKITGSGVLMQPNYTALGGILGGSLSGATLEGCTSSADVYFGDASLASSANGKTARLGGIAGDLQQGNSIVKNCKNSGGVYAYQYNNNNTSATTYSSVVVGGIVGGAGFVADNTATTTIEGCTNSAYTYGYRGAVAGIVGYIGNGTVKDCTNTGNVSRGAPSGGIAAVSRNSSFTGCTAKSSIATNAAGSCFRNTAGIVAEGFGVSIDDCKSFCTLTWKGTTTGEIGGIIGTADAESSVGATTACGLGGTIAGTAVTADNCATLAVGAGITATAVNYWDGK